MTGTRSRDKIRKERKKAVEEVRAEVMNSVVKLQKSLETQNKQSSREELATSVQRLVEATLEKVLSEKRTDEPLGEVLSKTFRVKKQNEFSLGKYKESQQVLKKINKDEESPFVKEGGELFLQDSVISKLPNLNRSDDDFLDEDSASKLRLFHPEVVLFAPQIPPNTGTVARLCAAMSAKLNIIEPMGFKITEKGVRRAGLDYWPYVDLTIHKNWNEFYKTRSDRRFIFVETGTNNSPQNFDFEPGDVLIFGPETTGIPDNIMEPLLAGGRANIVTIPMFQRGVRSINLANSVSIVLQVAIAKLHKN